MVLLLLEAIIDLMVIIDEYALFQSIQLACQGLHFLQSDRQFSFLFLIENFGRFQFGTLSKQNIEIVIYSF